MPQDGSTYYYGRSVVLADTMELAIEQLTQALKKDHILLEEVQQVVTYEDGQWTEDDDFEVHESLRDSMLSNEIEFGCFISEKSR
ncbi:hypothetical protein [Hahella sp. CCB-MM4]|uniref:hypothetical protein n=1 Tax=Hahella sp. (strain CCB-MM4) TaxID=1926491 RepID=UPI001FEE8C4B|nr:hypothetical protein [Hahella sp. CCB-MM4]